MPDKLRTYNEICKEMKELYKTSKSDSEVAHTRADALVVETLKLFGAKRLVKAYERVDKWYA